MWLLTTVLDDATLKRTILLPVSTFALENGTCYSIETGQGMCKFALSFTS